MDIDRAIEVLKITIPVFAMIGLGKILSVRGFITEDRKQFINELIYKFSLPALVLVNIAKQRFENMWNPALILTAFLALLSCSDIEMVDTYL